MGLYQEGYKRRDDLLKGLPLEDVSRHTSVNQVEDLGDRGLGKPESPPKLNIVHLLLVWNSVKNPPRNVVLIVRRVKNDS
ncbi:hypothetical protein GE061_018574 [Apolygus lucorum]|uniref:Uncharacterized protein n=1 Tax=Apolygus lucorum TaxID=248454 RepID=A0A8S9XEF0_APOLU|nr:hypothetical protein GE061_018574 [Apolygus lucorum]